MSELLSLQPIGVIRTPLFDRQSAPRQPSASRDTPGTIQLFPGRDFEHALADMEAWDHIWVIFWFHLNDAWRPKVLPPRSTVRRGVFSTRAPHRPNPLGLSVLRLDRVDAVALTLHVRDVDMIDGTPVLDIKPYVPYADSVPDASTGWLESPEAPDAGPPLAEESGAVTPARPRTCDPVPGYRIQWEPLASEQAAWITREDGLDLSGKANAVLAIGPEPHPYRRIRREGEGFCLALKAWRIHFRVDGRDITVTDVTTGYRPRDLATSAEPAVGVHLRFVVRFGDRSA